MENENLLGCGPIAKQTKRQNFNHPRTDCARTGENCSDVGLEAMRLPIRCMGRKARGLLEERDVGKNARRNSKRLCKRI